MKKIIFFFFCFFFLSFSVCATEKKEVLLSSCVDGDTAKFVIDGSIQTVRFLAIDTPEVKHPKKGVEPWGKEASDFTCNSLKTAQKIELEYDSNSDFLDKYQRQLGWIFVDDVLLQSMLVEKGYGRIAYLYGEYKYVSLLEEKELSAKAKKSGIWSDTVPIDWFGLSIVIISLVTIIVLCIFSQNYRKKTINSVKRKMKKIGF